MVYAIQLPIMSTPVTYLHNLRKGDLANLAEKAGLTEYVARAPELKDLFLQTN